MKFFFCLLAYLLTATALFGSPLQPIGFAMFWSARLGAPYWQLIAFMGVLCATVVFMVPAKTPIQTSFRASLFTVFTVLFPTLLVGIYSDWIRHEEGVAFKADEVEEHSFFVSLHNAPANFQFFLHTAALKNCIPYAWSYREMTFYVLPPNVAVNVLPQAWIDRCQIIRR